MQKQRTGCENLPRQVANNDSSVGLYSDRVHVVWIAFLTTSQLFSHVQCPKLFGDMLPSYAAVDGELHADNYTGPSSCRPIVHVEAMIMQ